MDLMLADQAYNQGVDGGAEIVCKNMFAVPSPASDGRTYELKTAPGLTEFVRLQENIRGFIATEGLFDGDIFAVAGVTVYRIDKDGVITTIGVVSETGEVTMAATRTEIAICAPPFLYICDGASITPVVDPDLPNVYSVTALSQRFIVTDINDRSYWTDILDGGSVDGLNFFTAESHPDRLVRAFSDGEKFYNMGTVSCETMGVTTNPQSGSDAFARIGSGVVKAGLAGIHAVAVDRDSLTVAFLGHNRIVYITQGYEAQPISTPFLEEELSKATDEAIAAARCFSYSEEGETFFVLKVDGIETFVFGKRLKKWHVRETFDTGSWRADQYVRAFGKDYVAETGQRRIYRMSRDILTDAGELISKEFSSEIPVRGKDSMRELVLDGFSSNEVAIGMRFSDDGRHYSSFVDRNLASPDFPSPAIWRRLGKTVPPRRTFHFRITDSGKITIRGARVNDGSVRV